MADFSTPSSPSQILLPPSSPSSPPSPPGPPPRPLRPPHAPVLPQHQLRQISLRIGAHFKPLYELCKLAVSHRDNDRFDDLVFTSIESPLTEGGDVELAKKEKALVVGRGKHIFEERRREFGGFKGGGRKRGGVVLGFKGEGKVVEGLLDEAFECVGRGDELGFRGCMEKLGRLWIGEVEGDGAAVSVAAAAGRERRGSGFEDLVYTSKIETSQTNASSQAEEAAIDINNTSKALLVRLPLNQTTNITKTEEPVSKAKIQSLMREIYEGIMEEDVTIFLDCVKGFEPFPHDLIGVTDVTEDDLLKFQEGALKDAIEDEDEEWFLRIFREANFGWGVEIDFEGDTQVVEKSVDTVGVGCEEEKQLVEELDCFKDLQIVSD